MLMTTDFAVARTWMFSHTSTGADQLGERRQPQAQPPALARRPGDGDVDAALAGEGCGRQELYIWWS
jgi:hypothetical protein